MVVDLPAPGGPVTPITRAVRVPRIARSSSRRGLSTMLRSLPVARIDALRAWATRSSMVILRLRLASAVSARRDHASDLWHRRTPRRRGMRIVFSQLESVSCKKGNRMQIAGSSAIVVGGTGGLGEATVRRLHAAGAKVVV